MQKMVSTLYQRIQDNSMETFSIEYTLLAIQSALLGEITPELRTVFINLDTEEQILYTYFYYDGEASEQKIDLWDCVVTEASADLGPDCFVESKIERLDYPAKIPPHGYCAYLRKENIESENYSLPKVKITKMSVGYALLSMQHALLGKVTPELRAVVIDFEKEDHPLLYVRFYYDGEIPQTLCDLWNFSIEAAKSDFGNCLLDAAVERIDFPQSYPFRGRYAYLRKE